MGASGPHCEARRQFECQTSGGLYASPAQSQIGDGCGISGSGWRKSAAASLGEPAGIQNPSIFGTSREQGTGPSLAPLRDEKLVVRAAVLSIVLTLAVGPSANLLCSVWCHRDDTTSAACEHQNATTSPRVTGEDSCRTTPTTAASFTRDEPKRPQNGDQQGAFVRTSRLAVPLAAAIRPRDGGHSLAAVPPILIALRI
jgi:hypothetical protein